MRTMRDLLLEVDGALEAYTDAIASARDPSFGPEEQRFSVARARGAWVRLQAAHEKLCRYSLGSPSLTLVQDNKRREQ